MVVVSKQPNWLVIFLITRMIKKDIVTSFAIGGGPMFMKILHFLTPQTIALRLTVMLHLTDFIDFLEYIKERKTNKRFNNMEQNLWDALHCTATQTELAVLALYDQAISHPYMRHIRSSGAKKINMLDL